MQWTQLRRTQLILGTLVIPLHRPSKNLVAFLRPGYRYPQQGIHVRMEQVDLFPWPMVQRAELNLRRNTVGTYVRHLTLPVRVVPVVCRTPLALRLVPQYTLLILRVRYPSKLVRKARLAAPLFLFRYVQIPIAPLGVPM